MALKIDKETAKRLYPDVPEWYQKELVTEFGEECFKEKRYESIKTFSDACIACGTTEEEFNTKFEKLRLDIDTLNYEKIKIVVKAINDGWVPDWSNSDQYKYFPYLKVLPSGSGFSVAYCSSASTITCVGSRLCFESSEKAMYAANQFIDLYNQFLL